MNNMIDSRIREVIYFWFVETAPEQRFREKTDEFDALIKSKFLGLYEEIVAGKLKNWRETPEGILALIVVLDQFSRNMFRGDKRSFEHDDMALELATYAVENSIDTQLPDEQRLFIYMPYMHSESAEIHKQAVKIFTEYGKEINLKYEMKHKEIIDRFGRYPHRNEVLGRESTPEEIEFLKTHSGF